MSYRILFTAGYTFVTALPFAAGIWLAKQAGLDLTVFLITVIGAMLIRHGWKESAKSPSEEE
jgi:hypothetical protein